MTRRLSENNNTKDKENSNAGRLSSARISKTLIEKNNSILVIEINSFRLLFKIIERLRKSFLEENDLWEILASEVIKRVNALKKCC